MRLRTSSYKLCEMKKRVPVRKWARALSVLVVAEAVAVCSSPPLQPHLATVTLSRYFLVATRCFERSLIGSIACLLRLRVLSRTGAFQWESAES